jgi:hypothetical protein
LQPVQLASIQSVPILIKIEIIDIEESVKKQIPVEERSPLEDLVPVELVPVEERLGIRFHFRFHGFFDHFFF